MEENGGLRFANPPDATAQRGASQQPVLQPQFLCNVPYSPLHKPGDDRSMASGTRPTELSFTKVPLIVSDDNLNNFCFCEGDAL
jgi:hypothetical protein